MVANGKEKQGKEKYHCSLFIHEPPLLSKGAALAWPPQAWPCVPLWLRAVRVEVQVHRL